MSACHYAEGVTPGWWRYCDQQATFARAREAWDLSESGARHDLWRVADEMLPSEPDVLLRLMLAFDRDRLIDDARD